MSRVRGREGVGRPVLGRGCEPVRHPRTFPFVSGRLSTSTIQIRALQNTRFSFPCPSPLPTPRFHTRKPWLQAKNPADHVEEILCFSTLILASAGRRDWWWMRPSGFRSAATRSPSLRPTWTRAIVLTRLAMVSLFPSRGAVCRGGGGILALVLVFGAGVLFFTFLLAHQCTAAWGGIMLLTFVRLLYRNFGCQSARQLDRANQLPRPLRDPLRHPPAASPDLADIPVQLRAP